MFNFIPSKVAQKSNQSQLITGLLAKRYQELVEQHHIDSDRAQVKVLGYLQQLLERILEQSEQEKRLAFSRLFCATKKMPKNLYIYGEVGRGKSMLMDIFFDACPIQSKKRVHFHAFMQEVHDYMWHWRKDHQGDPLPSLALKIRQTSLLLCFDEFHVTDIADAMLLSRLFIGLFKQGVMVLFTSNQHPDDLYKNGLQRELFLPFIDLLKQSVEIIQLSAKEDYRLSHFKAMKTTFYTNPEGREAFLQQNFDELTNFAQQAVKKIRVKGRELTFATTHGGVLLTSFNEICGRTLGAVEYMALACEFNTILIAEIPEFTTELRDKVRRFVTLIDILYEQSVNLICTAKVPAEKLAIEDNDFNFKRTRSRLIEMQSEKYIQCAHLTSV